MIYQAQVKHKITEFYHFLYKSSNYVCLHCCLSPKKSGQTLPWFLQVKSVGVEDLVSTQCVFQETLFQTSCCQVPLIARPSSWMLSSNFASSEGNQFDGLQDCLMIQSVGGGVERDISAFLIQTKMLMQLRAYTQRRWIYVKRETCQYYKLGKILRPGIKLLEDAEKGEACGNERQWSKFIPGHFHPIPT